MDCHMFPSYVGANPAGLGGLKLLIVFLPLFYQFPFAPIISGIKPGARGIALPRCAWLNWSLVISNLPVLS